MIYCSLIMIINMAHIGHKVRMTFLFPHDNPERPIKHKSPYLGRMHDRHLHHHDSPLIFDLDASLIDIQFYYFVDFIEVVLLEFFICQGDSD